MVAARGIARAYTAGQPISMLSPKFTWIGSGYMPVVIFLVTALIFHVALRYTRYGKFTYAIGANPQAARVSGINVGRHLIVVYSIAGLLSGLAGVVTAARAATGQAGMGLGYELDAIAATVIGGTSLTGGIGRIGGTVIGMVILGIMTQRIHLSRRRRLLPGYREGCNHCRRGRHRIVPPAATQEGLMHLQSHCEGQAVL